MSFQKGFFIYLVIFPFWVFSMERIYTNPGLLSFVTEDAEVQIGIEEEARCVVCLDALSKGLVTRLTCSHKLHHQCLIGALKENDSCPLCRAEVEEQALLLPHATQEPLLDKFREIRDRRSELKPTEEMLHLIRQEKLDVKQEIIKKRREQIKAAQSYLEMFNKLIQKYSASVKKYNSEQEALNKAIEAQNKITTKRNKDIEARRMALEARTKQANSRSVYMTSNYQGYLV